MFKYFILLTLILFFGCGDPQPKVTEFSFVEPLDKDKILKSIHNKTKEIDYQDSYGETVLYKGVLSHNVSLVKELIDLGANVNIPDKKGGTPLLIASIYGYEDLVEILIYAGGDPNVVVGKEEFTPLMFAKQYGHKKIIKQLISAGAIETKEVQYNKNARALIFAELGNLEEVKRSLDIEKVDPNVRYTNTKSTLILEAVKSGNRALVDFLVERDADEYLEDIYGMNALDYAYSLDMEIVTKKMFLNPH